MQKILGALIAVLLLPVAMAHGAPELGEHQTWVVSDFGTDHTLILPEGYETDNIVFRTGFYPGYGEGVFIWQDSFGGLGLGSEAAFLFELGTSNGTQTFRVSTSDDVTWGGDLPVVMTSYEFAGMVPVVNDLLLPAYVLDIEVFVSYAQLGISVGDEITSMRFASAWNAGAGDWILDVQPGGIYPVPIPDAAASMIPPPESGIDGDPGFFLDKFLASSASELLNVTGGLVGEELVFEVRNPFKMQEQQVQFFLNGEVLANATLQGSDLQDDPVVFRTNYSSEQDFRIEILSDLGGLRAFASAPSDNGLQDLGTGYGMAGEYQAFQVEEEVKDTPIVGLAILGVGLLALRRRLD